MTTTIGVNSQSGLRSQRRGSQLMKSSTFAGACQEPLTFPVSNRILQRSSTNMKALEESVASGSRTFDLMGALENMRLDEKDENADSVTNSDQEAEANDSDTDSGIGESPHVSINATTGTSDNDVGRGKANTEDAPAKKVMPRRRLSTHAWKTIEEHLLVPIINRKESSPFFPLVRVLFTHAKSGEIISLRNLEKRLLVWSVEFSRTKGITSSTYTGFCHFVIQCLVVIAPMLGDQDKCSPKEHAYTNKYFILLAGQVRQYAAVLDRLRRASKENKYSESAGEKILIAKGPGRTGETHEFVRRQIDGTFINLSTGKAHGQKTIENEATAVKRNPPLDERSDEEADTEAERSMTRRKRGEPSKDIEHRCGLCSRVFERKCDLTKHTKTHSRPWKCPEATCWYAKYGWSNQKELDRHINDKHDPNPRVFRCLYPPCAYESKRESNCKQHMEKLHGYAYNRTKKSGKNKDVPKFLPRPSLSITPNPSTTSIIPSAVDYTSASTPSTLLTDSRSATIDSNPVQTPASMMSMPFSSSTRESSASICGDQSYQSLNTPNVDVPFVLDNDKNITPYDTEPLFHLQYPSAAMLETLYAGSHSCESGVPAIDPSESFGPMMPLPLNSYPLIEDIGMQDLSLPDSWLNEMDYMDINANGNFDIMATVDPTYAQYPAEMDPATDPFSHPCQ